ncbi:hypothetical protein B0H13DRAFT_1860683 [Mycena leptocephala]|nr:hypothetical protein B0H13DRAFT_1860683 [Mycena leptocephala]
MPTKANGIVWPYPARTFWNHSTLTVDDYQRPATRNDKGVFSYTPAGVRQGQIINAASNASIQGTARVNPKKDNSHLSYSGRSYEIGSSTGLEDIVFERTDIECWKNSSSAWGITLWENSTDPTLPNYYLAIGVLPNSQTEAYATSGLGDDSQTVALVFTSYPPKHMFAIATGTGPYTVLDKVQCDVRFKPYNFEVSVNMTSSLVTINPLASSTHDMDPTSAAIDIGFGTTPQLVM